ncbi:hypothetical protein [Leptotrichia sp. oral taxon 218]|uniref:hypothetical protein n=1 Tax=Leptotrichia sp. oral taxon 218 TaxID=712361 RepID=UPI0035300760
MFLEILEPCDFSRGRFRGGLKQNVSKETQRRVPILSKIPIIGPLFKYRRTNKEVRDIYIEIEAVIQNDKTLLIK